MKQFSVTVCYDFILPVVVNANCEMDALEQARRIAEKTDVSEFECDSYSDIWITDKKPTIWADLKALGWKIQKYKIDRKGSAVAITDNEDPDIFKCDEIHACRDTIEDNGLIAFITPLEDSEGDRVFLSITDETKDSFCVYESEYNLKDTDASEINNDYKSAALAYICGTVNKPCLQDLPVEKLTAKQKSNEIECFIFGNKDCPQRIKDLWDSLKDHINF